MTRRRLALLSILVITLIGFVVFLHFSNRPSTDKTIIISGIPQCSRHIDSGIADHLGLTLYGYVTQANKLNGHSSANNYHGKVRQGSCTQGKDQNTTDANGHALVVKRSTVIVDIPDAKQSWKFTYAWVDGNSGKTDLGTLQPTCLPKEQLPYGDFGCSNVLNFIKYGTTNYDPILRYMPYSGVGFDLDYSPQSRQVYATMLIPASQQGNAELLQNDEAAVPEWFAARGLDASKYNISYSVTYQ